MRDANTNIETKKMYNKINEEEDKNKDKDKYADDDEDRDKNIK